MKRYPECNLQYVSFSMFNQDILNKTHIAQSGDSHVYDNLNERYLL